MEKSKRGRSWRVLLTDVGIVVLGVGLALGAQQAVEWWHWRGQVAEARSIIATEMAQNVANAINRVRIEPCLEHRLDSLAQILDEASASGRLPPMGDIAHVPRRSWSNGAWASLVASQTVTHFPRQQLALLQTTYNSVERANEWAPTEVLAWSNLSGMIGPGRRLDPATEENLRNALGTARTLNRAVAIVSVGIARNVEKLNLPFSADDLQVISLARHQDLSRSEKTTLQKAIPVLACQPMGTIAPAHYGQGLYGYVPGLMNEAVEALPRFGGL